MERGSNITLKSCQEDVFHSLNQTFDEAPMRPTVFIRPKQNRMSKKQQLSYIQESVLDSLLPEKPRVSEMVPKKRQVLPIGQVKGNRIDTILKRTRKQRKAHKHECSFDTSATLIKLMENRKWVRYLMNLYIWLNICLRVGYVGLVLYYVYENYQSQEVNTEDNDVKMTQFYYWILGSFFGIRVLFILIIYKLLRIGGKTRDMRIKVVYDTYDAWFEDTSKERNELQNQCDSMIVRNADDELRLRLLQQQVNSLNRWILVLKTYIVFIPPECQFILIKKSNGFFQVQNFIMKTLEIFFFTPQLMYFLLIEEKLDLNLLQEQAYDVYNLCTLVLIADVGLFLLITAILICLGNTRRVISNL